MKDKILYGYAALFDNPDDIINAAEKAAETGYKKYDVHSPYPIHGMPEAMKLPPSKLGYVALVVGLSGALTALLLMYWISAVDYPIMIGGKPLFSFPAYVPVIFEVTVLSASIATVLTMLFIFFKLPNNAHPLHGTSYMKQVSSDKYGLFIQAEDEKFNEEEVNSFLLSIGAKEIIPIFYDENEVAYKPRLFEPKFIMFLFATAIITSGATYFTLNKLLYMVPFNWMMEQEKLTPQSTSAIFADGFGMRTPVEGVVARGEAFYPYKNMPEEAAEKLINPLPMSMKVLKLGEKKYDIYCSPCHGYHAEGDSRLRGQFPNPPSLHSEKVRNWSDGRIFHVITEGQNAMPSYSTQLNEEERWAVINYIRALQKALNARDADLN
ncbi:quinol:electron acceptor oxidoreductase subunit ActD [Melioribacter sp. OK-6-Me]|uniref:quinol:electron acceptor oxidoreductase subunit ActD n=1 Tax=unclassified Melioribacter TaxID=2627329 RepID=UPI003ED9A134